jgi:hypothetical protein
MAYFETPDYSKLALSGTAASVKGTNASADEVTHRKNVISCIRTCVARVNGISFYEGEAFDDPGSYTITITAPSFLIDIQIDKFGKVKGTEMSPEGTMTKFISDLLHRELECVSFS